MRLMRHALHPRAQSGGLALHYAAAEGASFEVVRLLFEAYKAAATKGDQARLCSV